MIKRMWKNHMRDRETIRAGVWIISMQDRVSSVLEFVCSSLSLCSEEDGQTKQREFLYSIWDRESRKTPHERETDRGWWCMNHAPSCFQTESQLSSRLCGYGCLSPETDRQPEKQFESWLWQTQSRVSTINTSLLSLNVKSFNCRKSVQSFHLEDVVKTSTLTGSHRFCRTLLQKQKDFFMLKFCCRQKRSRNSIFVRFSGLCSGICLNYDSRKKEWRIFNFTTRDAWTQIGMFHPIRMDHTNCLQVAIKTLQFNMYVCIHDLCVFEDPHMNVRVEGSSGLLGTEINKLRSEGTTFHTKNMMRAQTDLLWQCWVVNTIRTVCVAPQTQKWL